MKCRPTFQGAHCVSLRALTSTCVSHPPTSWRFGDWLIYGHWLKIILFHGLYFSNTGSTKFSLVINPVLVIQLQVTMLCQRCLHTLPGGAGAVPMHTRTSSLGKNKGPGEGPRPAGTGRTPLGSRLSYVLMEKCLITILFSLSMRNKVS